MDVRQFVVSMEKYFRFGFKEEIETFLRVTGGKWRSYIFIVFKF